MLWILSIVLLGTIVYVIITTRHAHKVMDQYEQIGYEYVMKCFKTDNKIPLLPPTYLTWDKPHRIGFVRGYNKAYNELHHL